MKAKNIALLIIMTLCLVNIANAALNFTITATNENNGTTIQTFSANVSGTMYHTTNGTITTSLLSSQLVYTNYLMTYLPFIVGVIGFVLCVVMYKLWSVQPNGQ